MSWTTVKLGDACDVIAGGTPARSVAAYWGGGVPWVKISDMLQRRITRTDETISEEGLNSSAAKLLPSGTLLISIFATIGRTAVLECEAATNQAIVGIIPKDPRTFDSRFLEYSLQQKAVELKCQARGVAQANINGSMLKATTMPLPPLSEQKRIAGILDAADALRAKRREALAQLDTLLQSTFLDMFGDPVTNPMGFPIRALSEFYINQREGTKCGPFGSALKKHELVDSGVPVWNMDNIDPSGRTVLPFRMWITKEKFRDLEAYSVIDGDVIISRAGTVGKMCVANSDTNVSIISTNLIRVRFGPELLPIYFVSLMTYCKGRVGRLKTGPDGAFTHMSTGVLDKLRFPYPPMESQRRFAAIVESIERQKARMRAHLAELDALFASLQFRAFGGTL